ncbi:hypothetical protein LG326_03710 [Metaplanococcus flavidus]
MRNSIRTAFILMGAGTIFYLFMKYSYLVSFLFLHSITGSFVFIVAIIGAIWAALKLDRIISESRYEFPIQSAAILLISLFFAYQMFASHFYSEQYLKAAGLEKVEQLFELAELDLDESELRAKVEEIAVKEFAYAMGLYGVNSRPDGVEDLEILEFKRRYHAYDLVIGGEGKSASYTFTRAGFDFKISGNSVME